jgi:hypothetical protein
MRTHVHLSQLVADDLLLDRLAARSDAGSDPMVALLAALSRHAETPLRPASSPRPFRRHRALTAMAVLVVGASGVGAAAAMTQPGRVWPSRDSLRMTQLEAGGATAPSTPVPAPKTSAAAPGSAGAAHALVHDAAGRIALTPSGALGSRGGATSTLQAAQGPGAVPRAAQPGAKSVHESEQPHQSFFLATGSSSDKAGKLHLYASQGKTKRTPDDAAHHSAGDPALEATTLATMALAPAPTPKPSVGRRGASSRPVLEVGDEQAIPAAGPPVPAGSTGPSEDEAGPDGKAPALSEPLTTAPPAADGSTSEMSESSPTSPAATPEQPSGGVDEPLTAVQTTPTEPVSSPASG